MDSRLGNHLAQGRGDSTIRIDDGRELIDIVHTKIADRDGSVSHVLRTQADLAGLLDQGPRLGTDHPQSLALDIAEHGHDQSSATLGRKGHRDPDVDSPMLNDLVLVPGAVRGRVRDGRQRRGTDNEVIDRKLEALGLELPPPP